MPSLRVGRSIHIGIDRADAEVYQGLLPALRSAGQDARDMRELANRMGCSTRLFHDRRATRDTVLAALEADLERMVPGDFLMLTISGHGIAIDGRFGDDPDGFDEAWCLYDGVVLDDELHDLLALAPAGADVLVISDICFAGGIVDGTPRRVAVVRDSASAARLPPSIPVSPTGAPLVLRTTPAKRNGIQELAGASPISSTTARGDVQLPDVLDRAAPGWRENFAEAVTSRAPVTRAADLAIARMVRSGEIPSGGERGGARPDIQARVISLAACSEEALAFEGDRNGLFTAALIKAIAAGGGDVPAIGALIDTAAGALQFQSPTLGIIGGAPDDAADARPFRPDIAQPIDRGRRVLDPVPSDPPPSQVLPSEGSLSADVDKGIEKRIGEVDWH